jgi:hypothetical protein
MKAEDTRQVDTSGEEPGQHLGVALSGAEADATVESGCGAVAAVGKPALPRLQPDESGAERGTCMVLGHKPAWSLVEFRGEPHERSLREVLL